MAYKFSLNYRVLILAIGLLPVLLWLGNWQLQRAAEKESIQATYASRQQQSPAVFDTATLASLEAQADLSFLNVRLIGQFDAERWFLLDNRIQNGKVGYEVLNPFITNNGDWLIVNRGWVEAPAKRSELPTVSALPETDVELVGQVYVPDTGYQLAGIESSAQAWPKVITVFDQAYISQQLGQQLFPYQVRLSAGQPSALVTDWPPINVSPEKHRGYALQWFAMAAALVIWLVFASFRKQSLIKEPLKM